MNGKNLCFFLILVNSFLFGNDNLIGPLDSNISYQGRYELLNNSVSFSWPGSGGTIVSDDRSISLVFQDEGLGGEANTNFIEIIVDGKSFKTIELSSKRKRYSISINQPGTHVIQFFKRTEAVVGSFLFFGVKSDKALKENKRALDRRIEWIGNSLTCGFGNMVSIPPPPQGDPNVPFTSKNENNYLAWGAITSRALNADYMCSSFSGLGVYRNYDNSKVGTLPQVYDLLDPTDSSSLKWDFKKYTPQLLVINLGTNDFGPETQNPPKMVNDSLFISTYLNFLEKLIFLYPEVSILCTSGVSLSDYWPTGLKRETRSKALINSVVSRFKKTHLNINIQYLSLNTQLPPYGEKWHPTVKTQKEMSEQALPVIKKMMNW